MERDVLRRLCLLNQLSLTDTQKDDVINFFADRDADTATLDAIDTENVELASNQIRYQGLTDSITKHFQGLQSVMK